MKRHIHKWKRVRGLHVAIDREFCEFKSGGRQCRAHRGEDWSPCDQGLWVAALTFLYAWGWGSPFEDQDEIECWLLSLLRGF